MKLFTTIFYLHFFFVVSVFDIYFSPSIIEDYIETGNESLLTNTKRLILFVGDGLPAEHLYDFNSGHSKAPFLRSVIENKGTWGVSHTGVLSGSRPGHIAMIAGFYEDPLTVFRGLMENALYFDSVFNQSEITFSWGSPDIVPMFKKGSETEHIHYFTYPSEMEEISGRNESASQLNTWVLNHFKQFIKYNINYHKIHEKSKIVFFFHLSGTDVAGHVNKPYSMEYENTMTNMDMVIKELYLFIEKLFNDNHSTYLFTSDHGMTAWGSHGGGSKIETETPIIAWGAGIKKPDCWELKYQSRHDINQVDIAVLMSILLGVQIPVNSVGTLPLNYLDFPDQDKAKAYILNAKQLFSQLKAKEYKVKSQLADCFFYPYPNMTHMKYEDVIKDVEKAINNSDFTTAENLTRYLIVSSLAGLDYYHTYFQNFLLTCTVLSYLGLGVIIIAEIMICKRSCIIIETQRELYGVKKVILKTTYSFLFSSILILAYKDALPHRYIIYPLSPLSLCYWIILKYSWILKNIKLCDRSMINKLILYVMGSQLIVLSFYQKWVLSLTLLGFCFWPGFGISPVMDCKRTVVPRRYQLVWCCSCIGLSIFPLLTIIGGKEELFLKIFTGFSWIIIEFIIFKYLGLRLNLVSTIQFCLTPLLLWIMYSISNDSKDGKGLNLVHQCSSCILLILFLGLIYYGPKKLMSQFNTLSYSVGLTFLMFSLSYEAMFPILLAANLLCWILFERMIDIRYSSWPVSILIYDEIGLYSHGFRRSFFFVFYVVLSFFGIGNVTSLNTYDMAWIRSFVRSFSPLIIMSLMVVKFLLPFILVTSAFRSLGYITKANSKVLFLKAVLMCDSIALQFLLGVKNKGSSIEIENSVSCFVIMQSIALFLFVVYCLTKYIITFKITSSLDCDNVLRKWHDA